MIINSLQYNGACTCGKDHKMTTELCVIESGALLNFEKYLKDYNIGGYTVAVYDNNTYKATENRHPKADTEIILDHTDLHANEHGVAYLMENMPKNAEVLIAVGSGTIHDITRYCAYTMGVKFISCPTASSVDGFCSSVAAMTWHGCKKTLTAVAPTLVIADVDVIKNAPIRLTRSGFGDMIGKYIALTDWKIGSILTGEFYCERIARMTLDATEEVVRAVDGIMTGEDIAYEKLTYGLLLSGLAMQMMGNSRPASGAEHHISHLIEMSPPPLMLHSDALHGEKVGVGTLLALSEYKSLAENNNPHFSDYTSYDNAFISSLFGEDMGEEICRENETDVAHTLTRDALRHSWQKIREVIEKLPSTVELTDVYYRFGVMATLTDIGISEDKRECLLSYSHLVRNRLTLMRLRKCIK